VKNVVQPADINPQIPSHGGHSAVSRAWTIPAIAFASATSLPRQSAGQPCRAQQARVADADVGQTGSARRGHAEVSSACRPSHRHSTSGRIGVAVVALLTCAVITDAARAWADSGPLVDVSPPAPADVWVASSPPATATSTDGWTMTLSANNETQTPAPPLDPAVPSQDYIVGGVFSASLRAPDPKTTTPPSGTLEVGYQIQCVGGGLLATLKPGIVKIQVLKQEFTGFNPAAVVTAFRVQVDCVDQAMIRSYAILTRSANAAGAVVAYYGVSVPAGQ
jgi:hypothetical protein